MAKHVTGPTLAAYPALYPYVLEHIAESPARAQLRGVCEGKERAIMMGAPDEASFLAWLCGLTGARKVLEVGVFRGYTTLALAEALPAGGKVVGLDVSDEYTKDGIAAWAAAGVAEKIDLRIGPALETMATLLDAGEAETFDLVFIDADKSNYDGYYELALKLLRRNGVIAVDNTLWHGEVLAPATDDARALAALNAKMKADARVQAMLLPIADGCTLCRKL